MTMRRLFAALMIAIGVISPVQGDVNETVQAFSAAVSQWQQEVEFTCSFRFRAGLAASRSSAARSEFDRTTAGGSSTYREGFGLFYKQGSKYRFSLDYEHANQVRDDVRQKIAGLHEDVVVVTNVPFDEVTNGQIELVYEPLKAGQGDMLRVMRRGAERVGTLAIGPFSAAIPNPLNPLQLADPDPFRLTTDETGVDASASAAGVDRVEIGVETERSGITLRRKAIFRMDCAPPVIQEITETLRFPDGKQVEKTALLSDFQECPGGQVAGRVVVISVNTRADGTERLPFLQEWLSNDLGSRPPSERDFVMTVPASTSVAGLKSPPSGAIRSFDIDRISVSDISDPVVLSGELPREPQGHDVWLWILVNTAIIGTGVALWIVYCRRRSATE